MTRGLCLQRWACPVPPCLPPGTLVASWPGARVGTMPEGKGEEALSPQRTCWDRPGLGHPAVDDGQPHCSLCHVQLMQGLSLETLTSSPLHSAPGPGQALTGTQRARSAAHRCGARGTNYSSESRRRTQTALRCVSTCPASSAQD